MSTVNSGKVVGVEDPEKAERRRRRDAWADLKKRKPWISIQDEARIE
jgi:hypothetical protein